MTHDIQNQNGQYIEDVKLRDEIVNAIERDVTSLVYNNKSVEIVKHYVDSDGNKETIVHVDF